jgi:hypothetical protein
MAIDQRSKGLVVALTRFGHGGAIPGGWDKTGLRSGHPLALVHSEILT